MLSSAAKGQPGEIDRHLPLQDSLKDDLRQHLRAEDSPYRAPDGSLRGIQDLPAVNIIVEEAPSILNPARMKFGSVFRDISRQGRKFGLGLTVVSQQVSEIDDGILSQINTEITWPWETRTNARPRCTRPAMTFIRSSANCRSWDRAGHIVGKLQASAVADSNTGVQITTMAGEVRGKIYEAITKCSPEAGD